jgi:hypothetical protein
MSSAELKKILDKQQKLVHELFKIDHMLRGSYCPIYTKCGKPSCWCKKGIGHKHDRLSWREAGKGRIRAIPHEDITWVTRMTENYNMYKKLLEELEKTHIQIKMILNQHLEKIITSTKKEKAYLKI